MNEFIQLHITNATKPDHDNTSLRGRQTNDKVDQFRMPINRPTKICRLSCKNRPNLSATKIVQLQHILFSTRKSPNLYALTRWNTLTS